VRQHLPPVEVEHARLVRPDLADVDLGEARVDVLLDRGDVFLRVGAAGVDSAIMSRVTSWLACSKCLGVGSTCASSPGSPSLGQSRYAVSIPSSSVGAQQSFIPVWLPPAPPAAR